MAAPFTIREIEETVDGRVWVEWETVADDGKPLIEGDYITPETDLETAIREHVEDVKARRARINANPKIPSKKPPRRKRTTATLGDARKKQIIEELSDGQ